MAAATSSGRPSRPTALGYALGEGPEDRIGHQLVDHRGRDLAGGDGVHPDAGADPLRLDALAAGPPGQRRLAGRIDHDRLGLGAASRTAASSPRRHSPATAESQPGWPVIELEARKHHAGPLRSRQLGLQTLDERDRAEVVHRHEQRRVHAGEPADPGRGDDPVHDVGQRLDAGDRRPSAGLGGQVGDDVRVMQVDGDDAVPVGAQPGSGRGTDAGGTTADDVGLHGDDCNEF